MTTFRAPTLADADAIVALICACDIAESGEPDYDRDALLSEWAEPGVDLERDGFLGDGAYGVLLGTDIRAWVAPDRRGRGLGTALADALEARARERGLPFVDQQVASLEAGARALLEARGYVPRVSYADLRLADIAVPSLPDPEDVRPYDPERDEAAVQDLMERAFADGGGRVEPLDVLLARAPDTSLWFVVDAPDGRLAAAVRSEVRATGFLSGYVTHLATEPAHRGQGIAGRLLGATGRALVTAGAIEVRLHVRSSNPGALAVYQRLGFTGGWAIDEHRLQLA